MARKGKSGLFTYDFGVAIAQGTVLRIGKMTTAVTALAGAMYFLNKAATSYVKTLRENTAHFGGIVNAMQKMQQAQNRIVQGQTAFSVDDQMKGMNTMMSMGLDVEKNFDFINKAAHATGKSFTEFSGAIASGINGDMSALVQMGLITERASKRFDVYQAGTIQRQQAIMEFVTEHEGLQKMIMEDFSTINDMITQLGGSIKQLVIDVIGNPKDPTSLYGSAVIGIQYIADAFTRNIAVIRQWGERVGEILGWVVRNIGKFVVWVGRQFKNFFMDADKTTQTFEEGTKSIIVWLEFTKLKVKRVFKEMWDWVKEHERFLKNLALLFAGIFAVNTITKWVGALIGGLSMLNLALAAIVVATAGVLYAIDRVEKKHKESTKELVTATTEESKVLATGTHEDIYKMLSSAKGTITPRVAAQWALQLQAERTGQKDFDLLKAMRDFSKKYENMGGITARTAGNLLSWELDHYREIGKNVGFIPASSPKGFGALFISKKDLKYFTPTLVTGDLPKNAIPIIGSVAKSTEQLADSISNLGVTDEKFLRYMKSIDENTAKMDSLGVVLNLNNGAVRVNESAPDVGTIVGDTVKTAINEQLRKTARQKIDAGTSTFNAGRREGSPVRLQ